MAIRFHTEDVKFPWKGKRILSGWIKEAISAENRAFGEINVILCSDEYLLEMNKEYLKHDYYTDIITFNYNEEKVVSGDLFISLDRVKDNAIKNEVSLETEVYRVVIHGIMHLCGYNDKTKTEQIKIRERENFYLKKMEKFLN